MDRGSNEFQDAQPSEPDRVRQAVEEVYRLVSDIVEGVGEGSTRDGRRCVTVMVDRLTDEKRARIPSEVEGVPVEVLEIGTLQAE